MSGIGVGVRVAWAIGRPERIVHPLDKGSTGVGTGAGVGVEAGGVCGYSTGGPEVGVGGVGMMPERFSVAVGAPRVAPLGSEREIVAVLEPSKLEAVFKGMVKEAVD
jgi:hypothetical protein